LYSKQDNTWQVKKDDRGVVTVHNAKEEAIKKAIELAEDLKGQSREVVVHKANGTFGEITSRQ
jgi:RNase P/RNase MRP subunit POP5